MKVLKKIYVFCLMASCILVSACSSLGSGSIEKRANKLSTGLQKAYSVHPNTAQRVAPLIVENADRYNIDPLLLAALIRQESSYRSNVVSPAGAVGLTQVMPKFWQNTCPGDLFNEAINISCGALILNTYEKQAGDLHKALGYYNVGPTGYETRNDLQKQGKRYANQVKNHKQNLKKAL